VCAVYKDDGYCNFRLDVGMHLFILLTIFLKMNKNAEYYAMCKIMLNILYAFNITLLTNGFSADLH